MRNRSQSYLPALGAGLLVLGFAALAQPGGKPASAASVSDAPAKPLGDHGATLEVLLRAMDGEGKPIADLQGLSIILDDGDKTSLDSTGRARVVLGGRADHRLIVTLNDGKCTLNIEKAQLRAGTAIVQLKRKDGKQHCELLRS